MGGQEILYYNLSSRIDLSKVNLFFIADKRLLSDTLPNILWVHLSYDQENVKKLADKEFVNSLDAIVFVSHWQYEKFRNIYDLRKCRCVVIQNAIEEFKWNEKPSRIKILYTSTPWRGLEVLVEVLKNISRKDIDIVIYSGNKIYGPSFAKLTEGYYDEIYEELRNLGVKHIEYASNDVVRKELETAHILAYPCIFEETSCLSAIEALSAGCKVVTTSYGALPETCGTWADYVCMNNNLVEEYTEALQRNIDTYWDNFQERKKQYQYYKSHWSWETRLKQWQSLIEELTMEDKEQKITINNKEYSVGELSQTSIALIEYINNVDNKLAGMQVEVDQLQAARYRFIELLNQSVETDE